MPHVMRMSIRRSSKKARMLSVAGFFGFAAYLLVLPGRRVAHFVGLPEGSDHEQILSMFANTAFWTLVGVVAVIVAV